MVCIKLGRLQHDGKRDGIASGLLHLFARDLHLPSF